MMLLTSGRTFQSEDQLAGWLRAAIDRYVGPAYDDYDREALLDAELDEYWREELEDDFAAYEKESRDGS